MQLTRLLRGRGRGFGGFGGRGGAPSKPAAPPARPPPPAAATPPPAAAPRGPGLMGQMAATAGGVAVGSVVGHGMSQMLFGGGNQGGGAPAQGQAPPQQGSYDQSGGTYGAQQQQQQAQPCEGEMMNFLQCSLNVEDLNDCLTYKQQLMQCQEQMRSQ